MEPDTIKQFEREFNDDLCVIAFAVKEFGLPANLKLSVHSGSDKFSIYPVIRNAARRHGAGLHLKTAGTTWLEELIGLASAGGEGLAIARAEVDGSGATGWAQRAPLCPLRLRFSPWPTSSTPPTSSARARSLSASDSPARASSAIGGAGTPTSPSRS